MLTSFSVPRDFAMQRRYGAKIDVTPTRASDRQIFLVAGTGSQLSGLIRARGGHPFFSGSGWVLAELGFSEAMSLRGMPNVRTVCGVSVDPERIRILKQLLGQETRRGDEHG